MPSTAALPYHEPGIVTILILSSFLLLENAINYAFDRLLFCGLIGQIAVGVAWGSPGGKWLSEDVENAIMQLGYLGLILIVYEGGLSTNLKTLRSNLLLSSVVAIIGISAPIGLSFTLQGFMDITQLQAFAAGAALCSTSLGTTFTILSTSGLSQSRLGVVLSSAAMMDDIVGLVMSSIISRLGKSSEFDSTTVVRPVLVSVAFAVILPLICLFLAKPLMNRGYRAFAPREESKMFHLLSTEEAALTFHTLLLVALVTAASYAGTSVLFAAYLAGAASTWWDCVLMECIQQGSQAEIRHDLATSQAQKSNTEAPSNAAVADRQSSGSDNDTQQQSSRTGNLKSGDTDQETQPQAYESSSFVRGTHIFEKFYHPALQYVLKPFFFASIGFSIPISKMFGGTVVWKGIVYSILMIFAKLLCGLCLLRFEASSRVFRILEKYVPSGTSGCWPISLRSKSTSSSRARQNARGSTTEATVLQVSQNRSEQPPRPLQAKAPVSLYPAALLGSAMVARGEIGFLISSVAESDGVFGSKDAGGSSELFLVVTWAILLCTLLGPVAVGLMVKRVKRLQAQERSQRTGRTDPLGAWGILPSS